MQNFLLRNIMPKLVLTLREQDVKPHGQTTTHLTSVLLWHTLFSVDEMTSLLEGEFFPKWFQVLASWLQSREADFREVSTWYLTWRELFPDELLAQPSVSHYFSEALDMMSAALGHRNTGQFTQKHQKYCIPPSLSEGNDYFKLVNKRKMHQIAMAKLENLNKSAKHNHYSIGGSSRRSNNDSSSSFKDVVEAFALQHDMTFLPKRSSCNGGAAINEDGLALWVFNDRVTCYIDQSVVYARVDKTGSWEPVALDQLLSM
jgi:tuftelin-interacting protein 11